MTYLFEPLSTQYVCVSLPYFPFIFGWPAPAVGGNQPIRNRAACLPPDIRLHRGPSWYLGCSLIPILSMIKLFYFVHLICI